MLATALVLLNLLPAAPLPSSTEPKDIQCQDSGQYIGGIDRSYALKIGGPRERKWEYSFATTGGQLGDVTMSGTYEIVNGLAVFTGKTNQNKEVRFALNFGFPGDRVQFNAFFPDSDRTLRYQREQYRQVKGNWQLAERLVLTMPRTLPEGDTWEVPFQGEHVLRDEAGKETSTKIDLKATYQGGMLQKPLDELAPAYLFPVVVNQRLGAAYPDPRLSRPNTGGYLRGFHPGLGGAVRAR